MPNTVECRCGDLFKPDDENSHYIKTKGMCVNCLCGEGIEPFGPVADDPACLIPKKNRKPDLKSKNS